MLLIALICIKIYSSSFTFFTFMHHEDPIEDDFFFENGKEVVCSMVLYLSYWIKFELLKINTFSCMDHGQNWLLYEPRQLVDWSQIRHMDKILQKINVLGFYLPNEDYRSTTMLVDQDCMWKSSIKDQQLGYKVLFLLILCVGWWIERARV